MRMVRHTRSTALHFSGSVPVLVGVLLFLFGSCGEHELDQRKKVDDFVQGHRVRVEGLQAVMVLTDVGCIGCNRSFSEFVMRYIEDPRVCIVVSAGGQHFDISALLEKKDRIVWDDASAFKDLGLLSGTGAVLLNDHEVDTVIPMRPDDISSSLGYIGTKLK